MNSIIVKLSKVVDITSFARKMSANSFRGVPMDKIYRDYDKWHLNHLPPVQAHHDHSVLFELPIANDSAAPPKPRAGKDKWDAYHVRLPCAPQNDYSQVVYKTESGVRIYFQLIFW